MTKIFKSGILTTADCIWTANVLFDAVAERPGIAE
jgi:hypothetical protein